MLYPAIAFFVMCGLIFLWGVSVHHYKIRHAAKMKELRRSCICKYCRKK